MRTRICFCLLIAPTLSGCVYIDTTEPIPPVTVYYTPWSPPAPQGRTYTPPPPPSAPSNPGGNAPIPLNPPQ